MTDLINAVDLAIVGAEEGRSKLTQAALNVEGMSSPKVRHFLNNIVNFVDACRYLEIGSWKGSTLIAALCGNIQRVAYWAIDNFCEYGGSLEKLETNFRGCLGVEPEIINGNCFAISLGRHFIQHVNVYFYDGWHSEDAHCKALTHFADAMQETFIYIVDDWGGNEGAPVRNGTSRGIIEANLEVLHERVLPGGPGGWWNGLWVGVLRKRKEAAVAGG